MQGFIRNHRVFFIALALVAVLAIVLLLLPKPTGELTVSIVNAAGSNVGQP